ncbi:MAG: sensor histidine kinase [Saprospiraceae bacterium]|nr:sensor histidine kinase [Saprospiraceae bacterium]
MKPCLLLLWLPGMLFAQQAARRDSLLRLAQTSRADTARVWALMEAGKLYLNTQADTAAWYLGQALLLAEKTGFEPGIAKCRINLSFAFNNLGRYRESVALCQAALPLCERLGQKKLLVAAYNNMGNAWDFLGNRWQALEAFDHALQAAQGAALPPNFILTLRNNMTRQYFDLKLFDKGRAYALQSLQEASAQGDSAEVAAALQFLTEMAVHQGQKELALGYARRMAAIAQAEDLPLLEVFALNNIAVLRFDQQPAEAETTLARALAIARSSGDLFGEISALRSFARFSLYQKRYAAAKNYTWQCLEKTKAAHMDDETAACYLLLSDLALAESNTASHREYRRQFFQMNDTLANAALVHATQALETRFETEKKEQQIVQLEGEQALQRLRLRQKNSLLGGLAALLALLFALGTLAIRNLRHRRRLAEQELALQQQQLLQLQQEQQLSVADAVLRSQEDERSRLARDLHDGLGGMLSGVKQSLNGMKGNQILSETGAMALSQVISDLDRSIGELRHIARNMMPEALVRFGLRDALHDYCDHLRLATGLQLHFQAFGLNERLPQQTEVILFRIAQELLNNIQKHAGAQNVLVQLMENEGRLSLTVEDDGKGFDPEQLKREPGVGWLNIRARVEYLNGSLDLRTRPGAGTSVSIEVPAEKA